eukprot:366420-Chlamydomonas_euryale.AAC.3
MASGSALRGMQAGAMTGGEESQGGDIILKSAGEGGGRRIEHVGVENMCGDSAVFSSWPCNDAMVGLMGHGHGGADEHRHGGADGASPWRG